MSKLLKLLATISGICVFMCGCAGGISDTTSKNEIYTEPPSESNTQCASELVSESPTSNSTEGISELVSEVPSEEFEVTSETIEAPVETTEPTTSTVAEMSEETSEYCTAPSTSEKLLYGICNRNTVVTVDNGDTFKLFEGQKVAIIKLCEPMQISWYGDSASVDSSCINVFPEDYAPEYTRGNWAGAISCR